MAQLSTCVACPFSTPNGSWPSRHLRPPRCRHGRARGPLRGSQTSASDRTSPRQGGSTQPCRPRAHLHQAGALLSSSPGLFPESLADECRLLLDRLPAERFDRVRKIIEADLGASISEAFSSFDEDPIAAASIAQVYRAELSDGTPVAVKVRRPHLRARVESDVRLMRILAAVLEHAGTIGGLANPVAIVEDFATTLVAELDFRNEAAAMEQYGAALAHGGSDDLVFAPRPVPGMISSKVLVMELIDGILIDVEAVGALFALGVVATPDTTAAAEELRLITGPLLAAPLSEIRYAEILGQVLRVAGRHQVLLRRDFGVFRNEWGAGVRVRGQGIHH